MARRANAHDALVQGKVKTPIIEAAAMHEHIRNLEEDQALACIQRFQRMHWLDWQHPATGQTTLTAAVIHGAKSLISVVRSIKYTSVTYINVDIECSGGVMSYRVRRNVDNNTLIII